MLESLPLLIRRQGFFYAFTDKQGQRLLERALNGSEYLDTYYVYDDYGCLRFVLQPMYQTTASLALYAFQYKYDEHNNCTWKKLPGTEHVIYEYDAADRMVFSQDGNQRSSGRKTFYEYDSLSRLVKQGEAGLPANQDSVYIYNYYDNYTDLRSAIGSNGNYPDDTSGNSRGFLTGTMTKVLGTDTKLYTALYYDIEGRVTKKVQQNLLGGHDITTTTYSFSGKPLTVAHEHKDDDDNILLEEIVTYTYDEKDRVSTVKHKLDNTEVTLASYTYDTLGRMATKKLHGSATNRLTYSYNIQNWLTGISSTKFTQALTYNNGTTGYYNGNISSMNWNANGASHSYTFTYDGVNRMLNATHGTGAYTEKVTSYDKNGNIKALQRYGNGLIDNLTYTYSGNQLTKVEDATGNTAGFNNGASTANEYVYDNNGNLTKDSNKGITNIAYNSLNLPSTVTFTDGSTIVYSYAADGTKLRTVHTINGTTTTKDYCSNVVYKNGVQKMLLTEEGYVDLSVTTPAYYYYLKDHQGNNRVVLSSGGTAVEVNHYYPFGGILASTGNVQLYKYNGKELDAKKGLNWYDYGARHYDATLGRWFAVDPLAEKMSAWSPYAYCYNSPIKHIDPNGCDVKPYGEEELAMIKNTLPKEARQYVILGKNGYIDKNALEKFTGNSANFEALKELVNSKYDISVRLGTSYSYMANDGSILSHEMNYLEPDEDLADEDFQYTNGLTTGEGGNNGVTLLPGKGESGVNSMNDSRIDVIIHQSLSETGRAETYSHEANGHALMYVRTQDRYKSAHQQRGLKETNIPLRNMIINSRKETIKNMR